MLACRACRVPVTAEGGCALCAPIKRNLVDDDADELDRPSLSDVGAETVAALREVLRESRDVRRTSKDDPRARAAAAERIVRVSNSLAKVVEAARKLQTDGVAAIRAMSFAERAELYVSWYTGLPPSSRTALRTKMAEFETAIARPLELTA